MARQVKTYSLLVDGSYTSNQVEVLADHGKRAKEVHISNLSESDLFARFNEDTQSVFTVPAGVIMSLGNLSVSIVELSTIGSGGTPSDVEVICLL